MSRLRPTLALFAIAASSALLAAQDGPNYEQAEHYSAQYLRQRQYSTSVNPNWIGETDSFWYSYQDRFGWRYHLVDPVAATKRPLFDHQRLAADLSVAVKQPVDAEHMQLSNAKMDDEGKTFSFVYRDHKFELDLASGTLADKGEATDEDRRGQQANPFRGRGGNFRAPAPGNESEARTHRNFAPDHTAYVFVQGHDLYYVEASEEVKKEIAAIDERLKKEEEAKEKAEEVERVEAGSPSQDGVRRGGRGRRGEGASGDEQQQDEGEKKQDEQKVTTVLVKPLGEEPAPRESDERRKWADRLDERQALRLTEDGEEDYSFAGRGGGRGRGSSVEDGQGSDFEYDDYAWELEYEDPWAPADEEEVLPKTRPSVTWAPDSSAFYATRSDSRGVAELFLVNSIADPRPALETYAYPMPGEEKVRHSELHLFDRAKRVLSRVEPRWKDEQYRSMRWTGDEDSKPEEVELRMLRQDRLVRNLEYCAIDPRSGASKVLIEEGFVEANISPQGPRYLEERDEFVWWSDRTGWGHFYLYGGDGKLKNAITSGKWRASRIVDIDEEKGLLYFTGNGRVADENIYNQHLYRVFLDGRGLACMDPGDATHRSTLSPTKSYLVDNCSRVDMAPRSILWDADGNLILDLEQADLSRLYEAGWAMPETFTVKAADGVTDLYGNMWKPFDFDPDKHYPIIAEVYPGPQTEGVSSGFSASNARQQLAQIGFIVVQVGHRGGTPGRSKAYHSYGYFNLRDYGLEDKRAALLELAERHPFIDIDRVGIYGHSGGGFMTAAAMMLPPYNEFFKVGISSAGNHDNNIYNNSWSERYHGLKEVVVEEQQGGGDNRGGRGGRGVRGRVEASGPQDGEKEQEKEKQTRFEIHVPTTQELAPNLKGHLLLVHGEIDNNVHPANTMRLVDALIKANKRFDLLIIPGARHGFGAANGYFNHKKWEFFAEHLLGDHQVSADILVKD